MSKLETTLYNNNLSQYMTDKMNAEDARLVFSIGITSDKRALTYSSEIDPAHLKIILQGFVNKL
jgi:hypothetical protein